jgi:hypothetical protein
MKLLMKSMFHAWKLEVKKLRNEHRMNGEKNYGIRWFTWIGLDKYEVGLGGYK